MRSQETRSVSLLCSLITPRSRARIASWRASRPSSSPPPSSSWPPAAARTAAPAASAAPSPRAAAPSPPRRSPTPPPGAPPAAPRAPRPPPSPPPCAFSSPRRRAPLPLHAPPRPPGSSAPLPPPRQSPPRPLPLPPPPPPPLPSPPIDRLHRLMRRLHLLHRVLRVVDVLLLVLVVRHRRQVALAQVAVVRRRRARHELAHCVGRVVDQGRHEARLPARCLPSRRRQVLAAELDASHQPRRRGNVGRQAATPLGGHGGRRRPSPAARPPSTRPTPAPSARSQAWQGAGDGLEPRGGTLRVGKLQLQVLGLASSLAGTLTTSKADGPRSPDGCTVPFTSFTEPFGRLHSSSSEAEHWVA